MAQQYNNRNNNQNQQNNNEALIPVGSRSLAYGREVGYTEDYVKLIKEQVARDATDDEFRMFLEVCNGTKLNPLRNEIYCWSQYDRALGRKKAIIHTGIKGRRIAAVRTGRYVPGKVVREYNGNVHVASTCTVWVRMNKTDAQPILVEETAFMNEWRRDTPFWNNADKASHQLDITAERHALEKAFPELQFIEDSDVVEHGSEMGYEPQGAIAGGAPRALDGDPVRREHLTGCLTQIGRLFCTTDQFKSLAEFLETATIEQLEARHESGLTKVKEYLLSEIGKVFQGDAFAQFLNEELPDGIDAAKCHELLIVLGKIQAAQRAVDASETPAATDGASKDDNEPQDAPVTAQASTTSEPELPLTPENPPSTDADSKTKKAPARSSTKPAASEDAEPVSDEEMKLVKSRERIIALLMDKAVGDHAKIDVMLDGRDLMRMSQDQLDNFEKNLGGDPF